MTKPKIESGHHPVESSRPSETNEPDPKGSDVEAAEQFMQLKADVNADLIRLEDSNDSDPVSKPVPVRKSTMQSAAGDLVRPAQQDALRSAGSQTSIHW